MRALPMVVLLACSLNVTPCSALTTRALPVSLRATAFAPPAITCCKFAPRVTMSLSQGPSPSPKSKKGVIPASYTTTRLRGDAVSAKMTRSDVGRLSRRAPSFATMTAGALALPAAAVILRAVSQAVPFPDVATVIAPLFGTLLGGLQVLSNIPALLKARDTNDLGDINPIPYAAIMGNGFAWMFYGYTVWNLWILLPNVFNLAMGSAFTATGYSLASVDSQAVIRRTIRGYAGTFAVVMSLVLLGLSPVDPRTAYGLLANLCLLTVYASPLSTIKKVVKTKDASSIDPLLCAFGTVNALFWISYGLALGDPYVYTPNAIGICLNLLSLCAFAAYGAARSPTVVALDDLPVAVESAHGWWSSYVSGVGVVEGENEIRTATRGTKRHMRGFLEGGEAGPGAEKAVGAVSQIVSNAKDAFKERVNTKAIREQIERLPSFS